MENVIIKQPFYSARVSGSISVYNGGKDGKRAVCSQSNWFDECEWYLIKDDGKCLVIKKCLGVEVPKSAQKFSAKYKKFQIISELPFGKFEFDEDESDRDVLVIYYR